MVARPTVIGSIRLTAHTKQHGLSPRPEPILAAMERVSSKRSCGESLELIRPTDEADLPRRFRTIHAASRAAQQCASDRRDRLQSQSISGRAVRNHPPRDWPRSDTSEPLTSPSSKTRRHHQHNFPNLRIGVEHRVGSPDLFEWQSCIDAGDHASVGKQWPDVVDQRGGDLALVFRGTRTKGGTGQGQSGANRSIWA